MLGTVHLATVEPILLAAVRRQGHPTTLGKLITGSGVWELMKARGIKSTGHNVVVYRDEPGRDLLHSPEGIPLEIGATILEPFESDDVLMCTATPAGHAISVCHTGPYTELAAAYRALHDFARVRGLRLGLYWEFYGHWNDDPTKLETTVSYLLS